MEIKFLPYNKTLAQQFAPALGDYSNDILTSCRDGRAQMLRVGEMHYIASIETDSKGRVLVIMCSHGENMKETVPILCQYAKELGVYGIRFHGFRRGVHRLIGIETKWLEEVFLVEVNHG